MGVSVLAAVRLARGRIVRCKCVSLKIHVNIRMAARHLYPRDLLQQVVYERADRLVVYLDIVPILISVLMLMWLLLLLLVG